MRNLVPLTKILLTFGTAVWAIVLSEPTSLAALCVLELLILLVSGELIKNLKALLALVIFAAMLGVIEYIGGGSVKECNVAALRMLGMTIIYSRDCRGACAPDGRPADRQVPSLPDGSPQRKAQRDDRRKRSHALR